MILPPVRRSLLTAAIVGSIVSGGHWLAPSAAWWVVVHALLPAVVFAVGAWGAGVRAVTVRLFLRAAVTVSVVATAFTLVNADPTRMPLLARVAGNYLVPFLVATIGGMKARDTHRTSSHREHDHVDVPGPS